jgi:hypothetical protein
MEHCEADFELEPLDGLPGIHIWRVLVNLLPETATL